MSKSPCEKSPRETAPRYIRTLDLPRDYQLYVLRHKHVRYRKAKVSPRYRGNRFYYKRIAMWVPVRICDRGHRFIVRHRPSGIMSYFRYAYGKTRAGVGNFVLKTIRRIITGIRLVETKEQSRRMLIECWAPIYVGLYLGTLFVIVFYAGLTLSTAAGLLAQSSSEASKSLVLSTRTIGRKVSRQLSGACCGSFSVPAAGDVIGWVKEMVGWVFLLNPRVETGFILVGHPYR